MLKRFLHKDLPIYPLISFRIGFGLLMLFGLVRTLAQGWVNELYIKPKFFFSFYGFSWLPRFGETGIYTVYSILILAAICIAIGFYYKLASVSFFLGFTYLELFDATNYLNHYYLVCLFSFLLIFIPANRAYSVDVHLNRVKPMSSIPAWCIYIVMAQIAIVYTYAGLAKLHPEWLLHGMPLKIWLAERENWPVLGWLFSQSWTANIFSIFGCVYDLFIFWFLIQPRTRKWAYVFVLVFHLLTWSLFNIGLFPLIMIVSNIIFFSPAWHQKLLGRIGNPPKPAKHIPRFPKWLWVYLVIQICLPIRFLLYPSQILWAEQGYRFSWRVMLVEKSGLAQFTVKVGDRPAFQVQNSDFLSPFQEKQMAIQPDFILQYAHFLGDEYQGDQSVPVQVFVQSNVAINGRVSQALIDPKQDLMDIEDDFTTKKWIIRHPNL